MNRNLRMLGAALAMACASGGLVHAQSVEPTLVANLDTLPVPALPRLDARQPVTAPTRAYAVDGASFYLEGQRIRVQGVDTDRPEFNTALARQKLQLTLDGGEIEVDAIGEDDSGALIARVSVQGRDLLELLR